MDTVAIFP